MIKNILVAPIIALGIYLPSIANADVLGLFAGYGQWSADSSGQIADDGRSVDIQDELNLDTDSSNIYYIGLEHPVPVLPNIRLQHTDLAGSGVGTISEELEFNGEIYPVDAEISSDLDLTHTDATLYYQLFDTVLGIDLGLTARKFDGTALLLADDGVGGTIGVNEDFDVVIPMVYARIGLKLPLTGLTVDAKANYISRGNDSVTDTIVSLNYEATFGLGLEAGYRTFDIDVEDDGFIVDTKIDGAYMGISYHF
ncbi:MAG: TIGR04219 family outer membrane beta-barrel protein [Porticoccaceae bacterium]